MFFLNCLLECSVSLPPCVGLSCVIVAIPGHTHLLFQAIWVQTRHGSKGEVTNNCVINADFHDKINQIISFDIKETKVFFFKEKKK